MRVAAKHLLGSKRKPIKKIKSKSKGVKIKLKIKAKSPESMAGAMKKLARGVFKNADGTG